MDRAVLAGGRGMGEWGWVGVKNFVSELRFTVVLKYFKARPPTWSMFWNHVFECF